MSLAKELFRLMRHVRKLTDGQVIVEDFDNENDECQVITVYIEPNDGLYKGGRFKFLISIPESYPHGEIPAVWCDSKIYHPNIDVTESKYDHFTTNVCLNILEHGTWDNSFGLGGIVLGLLFLMHNPNFDDPLSPHFSPGDDEYHIENVGKFMNGEDIDGEGFELERVGKGAETKVDTVTEVSDVTETTEGVTKANDEVVRESVEDGAKSSTGLESAVDVAPSTGDGMLLTREDEEEIEKEIEYRVMSLDGDLVFMCENSNDTDVETNNEDDVTHDRNTLTVTGTSEDKLNYELTNTVSTDPANELTHADNDTGEINTVEGETETANERSGDMAIDLENTCVIIGGNQETGEEDTTEENDAGKIINLEKENKISAQEQNSECRHGSLEDDIAGRKRDKEHCSNVEVNETPQRVQACFVCANGSIHRQFRGVRRTAGKLFGNIRYIGRTLLQLLNDHNRY